MCVFFSCDIDNCHCDICNDSVVNCVGRVSSRVAYVVRVFHRLIQTGYCKRGRLTLDKTCVGLAYDISLSQMTDNKVDSHFKGLINYYWPIYESFCLPQLHSNMCIQ